MKGKKLIKFADRVSRLVKWRLEVEYGGEMIQTNLITKESFEFKETLTEKQLCRIADTVDAFFENANSTLRVGTGLWGAFYPDQVYAD